MSVTSFDLSYFRTGWNFAGASMWTTLNANYYKWIVPTLYEEFLVCVKLLPSSHNSKEKDQCLDFRCSLFPILEMIIEWIVNWALTTIYKFFYVCRKVCLSDLLRSAFWEVKFFICQRKSFSGSFLMEVLAIPKAKAEWLSNGKNSLQVNFYSPILEGKNWVAKGIKSVCYLEYENQNDEIVITSMSYKECLYIGT